MVALLISFPDTGAFEKIRFAQRIEKLCNGLLKKLKLGLAGMIIHFEEWENMRIFLLGEGPRGKKKRR